MLIRAMLVEESGGTNLALVKTVNLGKWECYCATVGESSDVNLGTIGQCYCATVGESSDVNLGKLGNVTVLQWGKVVMLIWGNWAMLLCYSGGK